MMILRSLLASAVLVSAVPAFAVEPAATAEVAAAPTTAPAPAPAAAVPAAPAAPKERIICKKEMDIGSWVRGTRRCATVSEWRKSSQAARDTTARIQDQKGAFNQ